MQELFAKHCAQQLTPLNLHATFSQQRLLDIFGAWEEDLDRSKGHNFRSDEITPDHIKSAAHLTYWIRRQAPIINLITALDNVNPGTGSMYDPNETIKIELEDIPDATLVSDEEAKDYKLPDGMTMKQFVENRGRVFAYGNELLAFTFGFSLAKAYEEQKQKERGLSHKVALPTGAFTEDLCYFLKFKNVSPHSIDLIYRALLMVPDQT